MDFNDTSRPTNPGIPELEGADDVRVPTFTLLRGGLPGRMYRVMRDGLTFGRLPECEVQLDDAGVSRKHAQVFIGRGDSVEIRDAGSTNGTFVNGRRVESARLHDGDKVQLGSTVVLRFNFQDALDEAFQRQQFESITRDALTGCHNRLYFDEALRRELAYAQRKATSLSVGLIDLDRFKDINDEHGHAVGDQVLQAVAQAIYSALRAYDVLSRYGGEEFAILLRGADIEGARAIGERLRLAVRAVEIRANGAKVQPSVSIGLADTIGDAEHGADARGLLRAADRRLYAAKAAGRDRVVWDDPDDTQRKETTRPVDLDSARRAIAKHRFSRTLAAIPSDEPAVTVLDLRLEDED